jgi:hypothetical protein
VWMNAADIALSMRLYTSVLPVSRRKHDHMAVSASLSGWLAGLVYSQSEGMYCKGMSGLSLPR